METWVSDWLADQRKRNVKGYEVKKTNNSYYVYKSTTYWDKSIKKVRKRSSYIGKLDKNKGLVESSGKVKTRIFPRSVRRYGDALLLNRAMESLIPVLKDSFDCWEDIYALSLVRVYGYVPLKRVRIKWDQLYNPLGIKPNLEPKHLSLLLKEIGSDRIAQNSVFHSLMKKSEHFAYDVTVVFTRSSMDIAEPGYNRDRAYLPQVEFLLLSSTDTNLPSMMRVVPGSIRDVETLTATIQNLNIDGITFILDRGFFSEENVKYLHASKMNFIMPARRNSFLYGKAKKSLDEHFFYRERLIKCSKKRWSVFYLYLYEDGELRKEEEKTIFRMLDDGAIEKDEFNEKMKKAGRILLISNINRDCLWIYGTYKSRDIVEKHFDVSKNVLRSDIMYLQDDESVFGHLFISFLSLYGYCTIQNMLRKGELLDRVSPIDLLEEFSTVYIIEGDDNRIITEIPKKVRLLNEKIGEDIFPKNQS
jgi:transposase